MPRVSDEHRAAQRRRIIDATLTAFGRTGFGGTSMSDVIAESGLSAGAIYGYFSGKEALMEAVAAELVADRMDDLEALRAQRPMPSPLAVVRNLAGTLPPELLRSGLLLDVWAHGARDERIARLARAQLEIITERMGSFATEWFREQGRPDAEALGRAAGSALTGIVQGYMVRAAVLGPEAAADYLDAVEALWSSGVPLA